MKFQGIVTIWYQSNLMMIKMSFVAIRSETASL